MSVLVKSIPLRDVRCLGNWKDAPLGALLQVTYYDGNGEVTRVTMRCEFLDEQDPDPCLLVLDGIDGANLLERNASITIALDISMLAEIRLKRPAPRKPGEMEIIPQGIACESRAGSGNFFCRAITLGGYRTNVWLAGDRIGKSQQAGPVNPIVVGEREVVLKQVALQ